MRVVIDARALGGRFPGIGRATEGLLGGLHRIEHDHKFVVLHQPEHRPTLQRIGLLNDGRFVLHPWTDTPLGMAQQWNSSRLARRFKPDVWHAPYYVRPLLGLPPTIVTVFDTIGVASSTVEAARISSMRVRSAVRQLAWQSVMYASLRTAHHVVTASEAARRDLERLYRVPASKLTVVPLATEPRFQPPATDAVADVRARHNLPAQYVLYLGSNKPHKNLVALVEAWALVVRDAPSADVPTLVIAGREDHRYDAARRRATEIKLSEHVRWMPDVPDDDVPALLGGATVFVFPSLHEGFGFPPLEAMACGTPMVCSNRTSLPEVVGDAGLTVDPEPAALATGMRQLLADPDLRADLRRRGLQGAASFSWERTAQTMLDVYRGVGNRE